MPDTHPCNLSVVIPAFNEQGRIRPALQAITRYLEGLPLSWEIIVVDDGSRDHTAAEAELAIRAMLPEQIRLLRHPRNLGKGASVRTGVLASHGQFVLFCDADGATPIEELGKFLPALQAGADVVAGSRRIAGSQIEQHQRRLRQGMGAVYTSLTNWLVAPGISDITCGFKALRRPAAQAIFGRMQVTGWSFDAELFYLARRFKFQIVEIPVTWCDRPNTKVRLLRDAITSFCELLRIRWRALTGCYR